MQSRVQGSQEGPVFTIVGGVVSGHSPEWRMPEVLAGWNHHDLTTRDPRGAGVGALLCQVAPALHRVAPHLVFIVVPRIADARSTTARDRLDADGWARLRGRHHGEQGVALAASAYGHESLMNTLLHEAFHAAWQERLSDEDREVVEDFVNGPEAIRFRCEYYDDVEERACRAFAGFGTAMLTGCRSLPRFRPVSARREALHIFFELLNGTYGAPAPTRWECIRQDVGTICAMVRSWWTGRR